MDISIFAASRVGAVNALKEGDLEQALREEQLALKVAQDEYGPTSPSLVPILRDEAVLQWHLADYPGCEQNLKWALALLEKNLGPDDLKLADSLDLLAGFYFDLNRLEEAKLSEKRALDLRTSSESQNSQALARSQYLLARIEEAMNNHAEAQTLLDQAQDNQERARHSDPSFLIQLWNSQADIHSSQKDNAQAQSCWEKAMEVAQKEFPSDSTEVVDQMENLADFYANHGAGDKAAPLYASALKMARKFVGTNYDYQSVPYLRRLARAYRGTGENKPALDLWKKIISTESKVLGPKHPRVALDLQNLAQTESALGQKDKARKDLQQALIDLQNSFSPDHPLVLQAQELLEGTP